MSVRVVSIPDVVPQGMEIFYLIGFCHPMEWNSFIGDYMNVLAGKCIYDDPRNANKVQENKLKLKQVKDLIKLGVSRSERTKREK